MAEPTNTLLDGTPRKFPYFWVTWLTGLLSGEKKCEWAAWFRGHFEGYRKTADGPERQRWIEEHDRMVAHRAANLKAAGWAVHVEDANKFTMKGETAKLGGKPDLVAAREGQGLILDAKSGKKRHSDQWQVRIYGLAIVGIHPALSQVSAVFMEVEYTDGTIRVPYQDDAGATVGQLIRRLAPGPTLDDPKNLLDLRQPTPATTWPPTRVPTYEECRFCDLADCPDRLADPVPIKTDLF